MASMNMSLSKFHEIVKDREAWCAAAHGVAKSQNNKYGVRASLNDWQGFAPVIEPDFN